MPSVRETGWRTPVESLPVVGLLPLVAVAMEELPADLHRAGQAQVLVAQAARCHEPRRKRSCPSRIVGLLHLDDLAACPPG